MMERDGFLTDNKSSPHLLWCLVDRSAQPEATVMISSSMQTATPHLAMTSPSEHAVNDHVYGSVSLKVRVCMCVHICLIVSAYDL